MCCTSLPASAIGGGTLNFGSDGGGEGEGDGALCGAAGGAPLRDGGGAGGGPLLELLPVVWGERSGAAGGGGAGALAFALSCSAR